MPNDKIFDYLIGAIVMFVIIGSFMLGFKAGKLSERNRAFTEPDYFYIEDGQRVPATVSRAPGK